MGEKREISMKKGKRKRIWKIEMELEREERYERERETKETIRYITWKIQIVV